VLNAFCLAILLLFSTAGLACGDGPVFKSTSADGKSMGLFLSDSSFESSPIWEPGSGEPPLSISNAIQIAQQWAVARYRKYDGVEIREVSLSEYHCGGISSKWYYLVGVTPLFDGNEVYGASESVAVLFDRSTIGMTELDDDA
jgi:hypothetical protein